MAINISLVFVCAWIIKQELFAHTHYPIRFNRKNRMVYVFREDGSVLKAKWDDLYFSTIQMDSMWKTNVVAVYVLADDKETKIDVFFLPFEGAPGKAGMAQLKSFFEFYRRYMEEGPQTALGDLKLICLPPIDEQREGFWSGWERLTLQMKGTLVGQILMQVIYLPQSCTRWLAMRTSKIPVWPEWVEAEFQVDADDPWARDITTNPQ